MVNSRVSLAALLLAALLPAILSTSRAASPAIDRPGELTRQAALPASAFPADGAAQELPIVVRFNPKGPDEAEVSLRAAIIMARYKFLRCFQEQLLGRKPTEADLGSPAYTRAVAEVSRSSPAYFPFDQLTSLWVAGQTEETLVLTLAQPIRQAMANIIVDDAHGAAFPPNKSLRLVMVKNLAMPPGIRDLEGPGLIVSQSKTIALSQARQLVENNFPASQPGLARFAAAFVRPNTQPDPAATALLQTTARPYPAPTDTRQPVATSRPRETSAFDQQELDALAARRSDTAPRPISSAKQSFPIAAPEIALPPLTWIFFPALLVLAVSAGVLRFKRARKNTTRLDCAPARTSRDSTQDAFLVSDDPSDAHWRERTRLAEARADRAQQAIRSGVLVWMKEKFVSTLFRHRAELLAAQNKAQEEMEQLERRLEQLHAPLQQRIHAYEKRIAELEEKLANKGEENRHLLGARIQLARQQLERSRFESN